MQKISLFLLVFLCLGYQSYAQFQGKIYEQSITPIVSRNAMNLISAWCGGLNGITIAHADINNDSKLDLIIYDNLSEKIRTFMNIGLAGETKYSYQPSFETNFKDVENYIILKDYNCDGIVDLFTKGNKGVGAYVGYYQSNQLKFTFFQDLFYPTPQGKVYLYAAREDIPSIEDLDADGDLDICSYDVFGTYLNYYKNLKVEDGLPCDSFRLAYADKCWGKFYQGVYRTLNTNIICKGGSVMNKNYRDARNAILHVDMDNDGDMDLFNGNSNYSDVQLYYNNGNAVINQQDTLYNSIGHQLKMPRYPATFLADIDNDGDKDLMFTSHSDGLNTANYKTINWYKNTSTSSVPSYNYVTDTLLMKDMIDVGSYSYPNFFDFDKDGKKDLFIGTEGYYNNDADTLVCKMSYYKNTSVGSAISFEYVTDDFLNLSTKNYKGIFPCFGDITGDGIDDLVFGNTKGNFILYNNMASNNTVQPNFQWSTDSIAVPSPGKNATPLIFDFNKDGKNDLLSGNAIGTLCYYKDTSAGNNTQLKLITANLGNVKVGEPGTTFTFSAPFISKMDSKDSTYLLVGNLTGTIERYDSFMNNMGNFKRIDSNYSFIHAPSRTKPAIADLNNDGKYEMVVGNKLGGLLFYQETVNVGVEDLAAASSIVLYPNPNTGKLYFLFKDNKIKELDVCIYNLIGNIVMYELYTANLPFLDLHNLSHGMYFVRCQSGNEVFIHKLVIQ